ncbi:MAG: ABC transporter ATP-binding protein [Vulcanimicrobiaceae bacterium]
MTIGRGPVRRAALLAALGVVLLLVPLVDHNNSHVDFLANAGAFILLALGLNIVVGFAGLLDLGYAAFFAIGSYAYAMLASQQYGIHIPFWIMLVVASVIAAIFGILLGAPTLRLRGDYLAIVTLGFGEIVPQTFLNLTQFTNGPNGISSLDQPSLFGKPFGFSATPYYYVLLALIVVGILVATNLQRSRLGRAWMAIREDELAARHMGINTTAAKLSAFALGASFSGLAGVAYAAKLSLVSPDQFQFNVSVLVLSMLVLGGMGNIAGVIVGSFVLSFINSFLLPQSTNLAHAAGFANVDFTNYRFMLYGIILVLMMLFRPEGLIPSRQRKAEFREAMADPKLAANEQSQFEGAART